jgi:thioredoxin-like negative regulator of GroEL
VEEVIDLAEKYKDKIVFYKVNADKEKELCSIFNVVALPTLFIVSPGKAPIIEVGYQQNKLLQLIEDLVK